MNNEEMAQANKRRIVGVWSVEDSADVAKAHNVPWPYIPVVRWYQFWRWWRAFTKQYKVCRTAENHVAKRIADEWRSRGL